MSDGTPVAFIFFLGRPAPRFVCTIPANCWIFSSAVSLTFKDGIFFRVSFSAVGSHLPSSDGMVDVNEVGSRALSAFESPESLLQRVWVSLSDKAVGVPKLFSFGMIRALKPNHRSHERVTSCSSSPTTLLIGAGTIVYSEIAVWTTVAFLGKVSNFSNHGNSHLFFLSMAVPPPLRTAVVRMRRSCGVPVAQISEYLDIPVATVYYILKTWTDSSDQKQKVENRGRPRLLDYDDVRVSYSRRELPWIDIVFYSLSLYVAASNFETTYTSMS